MHIITRDEIRSSGFVWIEFDMRSFVDFFINLFERILTDWLFFPSKLIISRDWDQSYFRHRQHFFECIIQEFEDTVEILSLGFNNCTNFSRSVYIIANQACAETYISSSSSYLTYGLSPAWIVLFAPTAKIKTPEKFSFEVFETLFYVNLGTFN